MVTTNKISKSKVMKRAWTIYNNCRKRFPTFSEALIRAWEVEKANLVYQAKQAYIAEREAWYKENSEDIENYIFANMSSADTYYGRGAYSGD